MLHETEKGNYKASCKYLEGPKCCSKYQKYTIALHKQFKVKSVFLFSSMHVE